MRTWFRVWRRIDGIHSTRGRLLDRPAIDLWANILLPFRRHLGGARQDNRVVPFGELSMQFSRLGWTLTYDCCVSFP